MSKATIIDIAKALSVTPSTVSRALSGSMRVSEQTRLLVQSKAKEIGYEPNVMAASLRKGVNHTVGMIVPRINREFFGNVISGVEAILNPAGYNLLICQSHERYSDEVKAVNSLLSHRVAGVLISHSVETKNFDHLQKVLDKGIVLVQFDRVATVLQGAQISNDCFNGAFLATKHLIKNGYQRIGHFAGTLSVSVYSDRLKGYQAALNNMGLVANDSLIFEDVITRDAGFSAMPKVLAAGCDALYCAGDYAALGVIEYCRQHHLAVPQQFGVVGTANESFAPLINPSLSTLEQNAFDMGNHVASGFLLRVNEDASSVYRTNIPMRLIVRDSSSRIQNNLIIET